MRELLAYSTVVLTLGVAIGRPHVGTRWRIGPATAALAGVSVLLTFGIVGPEDIDAAARTLWRPFITIVAVMLMTGAAGHLGVLDRAAAMIFQRAGLSIRGLFLSVFVLSAATASLLNNDAAVLLLTPLVLALIRKRYPGERQLLAPFAFVVFMAAGVAPFVVSNPMNMIVAASAGLNFNRYAQWMAPISLAGWIIAFVILRRVFSDALAADPQPTMLSPTAVGLSRAQRHMLALLLAVLGSYPLVASLDRSAIWMVSASGAALAVVLAWREGRIKPRELLVRGVAWDILIFLLAVFVLAIGLRNVGLVSYLAGVYEDAGIAIVGTVAAIGSALLNNHPMAIMNLLALESTPGAGEREILAALIGGDLGPRLLPIGSLAGLLWLESCRRLGVEISLRQFVQVGFAVTIPTLAASLLILSFR
ncbi:MAG: ArsB/NhaD family transporter [Vicinamibacterales bacterium]